MSTIPTYTKEEDEYYEKLLTEVSQRIGIDKNSPDFNKNDERSRLYYYFISQKMQENKIDNIKLIENTIKEWEDNNEHTYWIDSWNNILNKIKNNEWHILYKKSELMQELRSFRPFKGKFIDDKLRFKIIKFINKKE